MKNKHSNMSVCMLPAVALAFVITLSSQSSRSQEVAAPALSAVEGTTPLVTAERAVAGQDTWAKYQVILQRNIFSRQRGPIRQRRAERARPVATRNPESYLLLKGLVQEDGTFIAFVEDTQGNRILRLREGDSVARGLVKNFTLDSIEYQLEDQTTSVAVGRDLEGGQGTLSMNRLLELSATSSPTSDPNAATEEPTPSGDEAEILRKLMEQRKQQLGQ